MRAREIAGEVRRSIETGQSRVIGLSALLVVVLALGVVLSTYQTATAMRLHREQLTDGVATTMVIQTGGIDARRCVALSHVDGVVGAIALRDIPGGATLAALPSFAVTEIAVAGDTDAALGTVTEGRRGLLLPAQLAENLNLHPGEQLALSNGATAVAGVFEYPADGRAPVLSNALLVPVPIDDAPFDQCWVTVWPPSPQLRGLLDTVVASGTDSAVAQQQLNPTRGEPRTLEALLEESQARTLRIAACAAAFLTGLFWLRSRKLELGVNLHLGQPRPALLAQVLAESLVPAVVLGAAALVVSTIANAEIVMATEIGILLAGAATAAIGVILALAAGVTVGVAGLRAERIADWAKER